MGKKGEKYPAHQIARQQKFLMTRNHPPPPPPQELNGRPLSYLFYLPRSRFLDVTQRSPNPEKRLRGRDRSQGE